MSKARSPDPRPLLPALGGSLGTLLRGPGEDLAVKVLWQSGSELALELIGASAAISFPAIEELALECASSRGVVRLGGEVSPSGHGRLRFRVHDVIEVEQRRRFVRVRASRPVRLRRENDRDVSTFALDLSGGGLLLAGPDQLRAGEQIGLRLRLDPASEPIEGIARVVRVAGSGHPAVTFDSIEPADRERLIHFIFDSERRSRALARDAQTADPADPGATE